MVLKVKLNSPPPKQPPKPRFDYSAVFSELRRKFSLAFKKTYGSSETTPPETSAISEKWEIWTDGSGSRGRYTSQTPAGWGYVVAEQDEIIMEASGPVVTSSTSQFYLGASVGSNNTGEISALVEAALYLLSLTQPPRKVKFFYDSKWAASMIKGESRPKRNKALVHAARPVYMALLEKIEVEWQWVKGHSGKEFNEKADQLADKGKNSGDRR